MAEQTAAQQGVAFYLHVCEFKHVFLPTGLHMAFSGGRTKMSAHYVYTVSLIYQAVLMLCLRIQV